jgi:hypothetical protein
MNDTVMEIFPRQWCRHIMYLDLAGIATCVLRTAMRKHQRTCPQHSSSSYLTSGVSRSILYEMTYPEAHNDKTLRSLVLSLDCERQLFYSEVGAKTAQLWGGKSDPLLSIQPLTIHPLARPLDAIRDILCIGLHPTRNHGKLPTYRLVQSFELFLGKSSSSWTRTTTL